MAKTRQRRDHSGKLAPPPPPPKQVVACVNEKAYLEEALRRRRISGRTGYTSQYGHYVILAEGDVRVFRQKIRAISGAVITQEFELS